MSFFVEVSFDTTKFATFYYTITQNGVEITDDFYAPAASIGKWGVDVDDGTNVILEATTQTGYVFEKWVYTTGTSTTERTSNNNPFTYTSGKDLYIEAIAIEDDDEDTYQAWTLDKITVDELSEDYSIELELAPYYMYRLKVSFPYSGTATFYTSGDVDTLGFLGTSTGFDDEAGEPKRYKATDDQSGTENNFSISYDVEVGEIYYLYVRCYDEKDDGWTTVHITIPEQSSAIGGGGLYILVSKGTSTNPYLEWVKATPHILTSEGGWLHWQPVQSNILTSEGGWLHWVSDNEL